MLPRDAPGRGPASPRGAIRRVGLRPRWPDYGCWIFSTNPPLTVMTPLAGIVHTP